jgi:hypothetical protein
MEIGEARQKRLAMRLTPVFLPIAYGVCYVLGYVAHEAWTVIRSRPQARLPSQLGLVGIGAIVVSGMALVFWFSTLR